MLGSVGIGVMAGADKDGLKSMFKRAMQTKKLIKIARWCRETVLILTHLYKYWQIQLYLKANNNAVYFRTNMQVSYRYISQAEWPLYALNPSL